MLQIVGLGVVVSPLVSPPASVVAAALGEGEGGGEEGFGAAQEMLDTADVGTGLAVGDRAIGKLERPPLPGGVLSEQVGLGGTPAVVANHDLRAVAPPLVGPDQVLFRFRQAHLIVERKATGARHRGPRRHCQVGVQVVEQRGLTAPVGAGKRDQLGIARQVLEIEGQDVESKPVADATKAFEGQREGIHRRGAPEVRASSFLSLRPASRGAPKPPAPPSADAGRNGPPFGVRARGVRSGRIAEACPVRETEAASAIS